MFFFCGLLLRTRNASFHCGRVIEAYGATHQDFIRLHQERQLLIINFADFDRLCFTGHIRKHTPTLKVQRNALWMIRAVSV